MIVTQVVVAGGQLRDVEAAGLRGYLHHRVVGALGQHGHCVQPGDPPARSRSLLANVTHRLRPRRLQLQQQQEGARLSKYCVKQVFARRRKEEEKKKRERERKEKNFIGI